MKEIYYKSNDNVILSFHKNSLWERSITSPLFSETKISLLCNDEKFKGALSLQKKSEETWEVVINWDKIIMTSQEDFFTVQIIYSGKKKVSERVKIKYPQKSVSIRDYNIKLTKNKAIWGTDGEICSLIVELNKGLESWMFRENHLRVSFKLSQNKGFTTMGDGNVFVSDLSGGLIPIRYIGYDHPIDKDVVEQIFFTINDVDCNPLNFTFSPRPYSYVPIVTPTEAVFRYGQSNRKVFQIQLVRKDKLSPVAKQIKILSLRPNNFRDFFEIVSTSGDNLLWVISINNKAGYPLLSKGCSSTVAFDIDGGRISCQVNLSLSKVLPGTSPELLFTPLTIYAYKGDKTTCSLLVKNTCNSEINVSDIRFDNSTTNLLRIRGKKASKIAPNSSCRYTFDVDTSNAINTKVNLSLLTHETEKANVEYSVCIKERPVAKIAITSLSNAPVVVGKTYKAGDLLCRCQIRFADDSSSDCLPIYLSQIEFGTRFRLSEDFSNLVISYPDSCEVDILFSEEMSVSNDEIDSVNTLQVISCFWNYFDQNGKLNIPILLPKLYGKRCSFYKDEIVFPSPEERRVVPVMAFEFRQLTDNDVNTYWDSNQKLLTQSPYSFSENEIDTERLITPGDTITYYLHINYIEEIDENTINIPEKKIVNLTSSIQSDNHPNSPVSFLGDNRKAVFPSGVTLLPIEASPKGRVVYRTEKGDFRLQKNASTTVPVEIYQQDDDVEALLVGSVVVQNLEKIPFHDNGIRLVITNISLNINGHSILNEKTNELLASHIVILNGQPEMCIPIYVDYKKWKESSICESPIFAIEFAPFDEDSQKSNNINDGKTNDSSVRFKYEAVLELTHIFVDDVYALDLGTTGIVVAKETEGEPECVILKDVPRNPIEADNEILSSHTMISSGEEGSSIVLAPAANDYYQVSEGNTKFRLVPSKFIIGQERIPFLNSFYDDEDIEKTVKLFSLDNKELDLELTNKTENEQVISDLIASLYREIFLRCDKEVEKIKKLVITYPNTYSIENLDGIKDIMTKELGLNLKGQICFVPESDAVAAYYFNQKIIFENGFLDEEGNIRDEENVIFYDMGAGTLDLSLVSFKKSQGGGIVASIVNKIGIPLAGNYLDYIIFKTLLDDGWVKSDMETKHNAIKELTTNIKKNYEDQRTIAEINPSWLGEFQNSLNAELRTKKYVDLLQNSVSGFIKTCSETALKCLIPEGITIHTVVFSGRGSQFGPIRTTVVEKLNEIMGHPIKLDELIPTDNCGDYLKTCVALGALKYQDYFNNDGPFIIENKNLYSKIAVVYWGKLDNGTYDVDVRYLVDPLNEDWGNAELINGTRCKEFVSNETISNHLQGKIMYYIQTCLDKDDLVALYRKVYRKDPCLKDDLNWAFVNLLFKKRVSTSKPILVKLTISKDNKIVEREIAGDILTDKKLLENVEDNILYRRSMWPFITTLK